MTRTDMPSLTRNKRCQFQRSIQKSQRMWKAWIQKHPYLHSLMVSVTPVEVVREKKSATRSMILPWFREFVHVPVRQQHNNSAGNQINRSETQIPWYRHTPKSINSFIESHVTFFINPEKHLGFNKCWNNITFNLHVIFSCLMNLSFFTSLSFCVYFLHYCEGRIRKTPVCV